MMVSSGGQLAGAQKSNLDERRVRLIVLHVISACDGIDEIAYVRQREVTGGAIAAPGYGVFPHAI
jgi:hypothetical protein